MKAAAIVAERWHLDIITVLAENDELLIAARVAGHNVLNRLESRARSK